MKCIEIPRVFINEKNEMEMIFKKIYITEKDGSKLLKFPVELFDEKTKNTVLAEIYQINANVITSALKELKTIIKEKRESNETVYSVKLVKEEIVLTFSSSKEQLFTMIINCHELGDEGEDIVAIDYLKNESKIDPDSFGLDLVMEVASDEFIDCIKECNKE